MKEKKKQKDIGELNRIYDEAESVDKKLFAEQRTNVLLAAGEHYSKNPQVQKTLRDTKELQTNQKLRLTKNHIHRAIRHYTSNILGITPDVCVTPRNGKDLQHRKTAELNQSVWAWGKDKYRIEELWMNLCDDFCGIGEMALKMFFDPNAGKFKGYNQALDEETGEPMVDEMGQPMPDMESPVFEGDFVFERLFAFNLMREAGSKTMRDSKCWIIRKMAPIPDLKKAVQGSGDDPDVIERKLKFIDESKDDTFVVFDSTRASYAKVKNECLVREYYYPASVEHPMGYYYITTAHGILFEGELPFGIFPIVWQGFDEHPTLARASSMLKIARPYQSEVNRAASSYAQHQITIGDDKILYQSGTKLAAGSLLPGVRGITYQGPAPTILEGRTGGQYAEYIASQLDEMDRALMIEEINQDNQANLDPTILLYRSMQQKKKFGKYGVKFAAFQKQVLKTFLELSRHYIPDDCLIAAIGKSEMINISEFKQTNELDYIIKIEERDDSLETMFGRQITAQHIIQYAGSQLGKDDIGKIIKNMPFGNNEESFGDLTLDYENSQNDMLSLERGVMPTSSKYENHQYALTKLTNRMKQSDYDLLDPQVQQLYEQKKAEHEQVLEAQAQALIDAKNEYVPVGGALIACDMYVPNAEDPSKAAKRIRVPYQALDWLVKVLEKQGMGLQQMENMNQGALAEMAPSLHGSPQPPSMPQSGGQMQ